MKPEFLLLSAKIRSWSAMRLICSLLLAFTGTGASAQTASPEEPTWICWYLRGTQMHCRLASDIATSPAGAASSSAAVEPGVVPRGRRPLPEIVHAILAEPEKLAGQTIAIPLFTESSDRSFVRELAEAVMCGAKQMCSVLFLDAPSEVALTMDALDDPARN
ncbi:hypothetical protein [Azoarcus sp. DN11]|uniref:hypothetical protein n=1 Tax=Azoarcus sp. DN11 TaxID=356837 RepID=UPI000EB0108C|nr:hypothetical protein [Azoarcus sp. DN11]AYH44217.1 hypothetical protein CDA09_12615 [Azoarcus sp. DN11]